MAKRKPRKTASAAKPVNTTTALRQALAEWVFELRATRNKDDTENGHGVGGTSSPRVPLPR